MRIQCLVSVCNGGFCNSRSQPRGFTLLTEQRPVCYLTLPFRWSDCTIFKCHITSDWGGAELQQRLVDYGGRAGVQPHMSAIQLEECIPWGAMQV